MNRQVDVPLGMPENPLSREELTTKFKILSASVVGVDRAEWIAECVMSPEPKENIYSLMQVR